MENDYFFLKHNSKYYKLKKNDILWLYAEGNYTTIHLVGDQLYKVKYSLTRLISLLGEQEFIRTHKSYAVNIDKVDSYKPNGTIFIDTNKIPLSRNYKLQFEENLNFLLP